MAEEDSGQGETEAWLGWEMTNSGHSIEIRTQVFTLSLVGAHDAGWAWGAYVF